MYEVIYQVSRVIQLIADTLDWLGHAILSPRYSLGTWWYDMKLMWMR
jgi:hypothetical protein